MEQRVSETILEQHKEITLNGESYQIAPPTFATLILFSGFVSQLPKEELNTENAIPSLLAQSDKFPFICKAIASIILGAKDFNKEEKSVHQKRKFWRFFLPKTQTKRQTKGEILTEKILHSDISEIMQVFFNLLSFMKLQDFFQLTTSLIEMNLTKPTKTAEVVKETIARGQL